VDGVQDYKVVAPPEDHAFVIFDPDKTDFVKIRNAIIECGYGVKNIVEKE
jgi:hypothetical protein